jgi:SAM-dependent methyltransferase
MKNYIEINRRLWNERTDVHLSSEFYDMENFRNGASSLQTIELELLGDIRGKKILHLQCHFGQDTLSLQRMGAQVTGMDLSDKAIAAAQQLNTELGLDARFICCDLYDLPAHLDETFDIVFTSYGTIGWLPDIRRWAKVVSQFTRPGGRFIFAEFHPVVWMFDDEFQKVAYRYFNSGPIVETESGTYADRDAGIQEKSVGWNHSISEVVNALIGEDMEIKRLNEYDYSPYPCFRNVEKTGEREYRIRHLENKIPMVYAIEASRKTGGFFITSVP